MGEIIVKTRDYGIWKLTDGKVYSLITTRKGFKKITEEILSVDLATLIKYDYFESNGMLALTYKDDGEERTKYFYCEPQKTSEILAYIGSYLPTDHEQKTVFQKRCRMCGCILTYTKEDIENNIRYSKKEAEALSSVTVSKVFGDKAGATNAGIIAEMYHKQCKDLHHCPDCGSEDLEKISK